MLVKVSLRSNHLLTLRSVQQRISGNKITSNTGLTHHPESEESALSQSEGSQRAAGTQAFLKKHPRATSSTATFTFRVQREGLRSRTLLTSKFFSANEPYGIPLQPLPADHPYSSP